MSQQIFEPEIGGLLLALSKTFCASFCKAGYLFMQDLRAKQIKQLCYEQLKNMSREDIRTAIHREDGSEMETSLNSMLVDLLGQDTPKGEDRESSPNESSPQSKSGEVRESSPNESSPQSKSGEVRESSPNESSPQSKSGEVSLSHENTWEGGDETAAESGGKVTDPQMEEFVIRVSDVSDDERDSSPLESAVDPSCDKRDSDAALESEDRLELTVRATGDDIDRELCGRDVNKLCSSTESDKYERECHGNNRDSSSDLDDDDDIVGVPETARLLEMELRKRALESELRRSGTERKEEVVPITDTMMEEESVDKGTLLELKLRQRALQALLVKKKTDT